MSHVPSRALVAALLFGLVACGDENNSNATDDDDSPSEEGTDAAGLSNDAGQRDAGVGFRDSGATASDAGRPSTGPAADAGVTDASATGGDASAGSAGGTEVPANDHCAPVAGWDAKSAQFEEEVLKLTNEARAAGHNCDEKGNFGPTTPLKMQPQLRCSARLHSKYMAETGDFNHTQTATMLDPLARMKAAGYQFRTAGENIAVGQKTPKIVVDGWLDSDGHCRNIMDPGFTEIGIGYMMSGATTGLGGRASPYWTQNFGKPLK
ncbi:MAG: hypothetical protein RLZZ450_2012 [Pseudomonadota bacterium]|jgi:uncharacterized protein YkwD